MSLQSPVPPQACELAALAGRAEECTPAECPLWENGACSLEPILHGDSREDEAPHTADESAPA
jgi:hypothetical protein